MDDFVNDHQAQKGENEDGDAGKIPGNGSESRGREKGAAHEGDETQPGNPEAGRV